MSRDDTTAAVSALLARRLGDAEGAALLALAGGADGGTGLALRGLPVHLEEPPPPPAAEDEAGPGDDEGGDTLTWEHPTRTM